MHIYMYPHANLNIFRHTQHICTHGRLKTGESSLQKKKRKRKKRKGKRRRRRKRKKRRRRKEEEEEEEVVSLPLQMKPF